MKIFVPEDVLRLPPAETLERITALLTEASPDDDTWYAQWWAADALTLMGRYREAVMMYPPPGFDRAPFQTERLLSLKVTAALPYTAADCSALLGRASPHMGANTLNLFVARRSFWSRPCPKK